MGFGVTQIGWVVTKRREVKAIHVPTMYSYARTVEGMAVALGIVGHDVHGDGSGFFIDIRQTGCSSIHAWE